MKALSILAAPALAALVFTFASALLPQAKAEAGCRRRVVVVHPRPAVRVVIAGRACQERVWVAGHWKWTGPRRRVWIPGHWEWR